ncbi:MFS transporter [Saccharopolyspora sp. NPDC003752]
MASSSAASTTSAGVCRSKRCNVVSPAGTGLPARIIRFRRRRSPSSGRGGPSSATRRLFPTEVRATAVGLCTGISRIGAAVGNFATPWALANLGIGATMWIATGIALVGAVIGVFMAPETKGVELGVAGVLQR